jgi:hypothetical protein
VAWVEGNKEAGSEYTWEDGKDEQEVKKTGE